MTDNKRNKRNERLAKWRWPQCEVKVFSAPDVRDPPRCRVYSSDCEGWVLFEPDTDPAAALELLGWLAEKPREWSALIASNCGEVIVTVNLAQHLDGVVTSNNVHVEVPGLPLTALPEAIAEAAEAVRKQEEGD